MSSQLDEHPLYARLSHLLNLIIFAIFIVTGLMIHSPYKGMPMDTVRDLHIFIIWIFLFNGLFRIYWAIFDRRHDWKEFIPTKRDWRNLFKQLLYYLFLAKHPESGKYNVLQKLAYLALFLLSGVQFCSGALLLWSDRLSHWVNFFGGLAAIRSFHFLMTIVFLLIIAIHFYLVFTESPRLFTVMFFGKEIKSKKVVAKPVQKGM